MLGRGLRVRILAQQRSSSCARAHRRHQRRSRKVKAAPPKLPRKPMAICAAKDVSLSRSGCFAVPPVPHTNTLSGIADFCSPGLQEEPRASLNWNPPSSFVYRAGCPLH
jgi:hypothetical protein